jgi:thiol-disulfide isomerase/thioredoxin
MRSRLSAKARSWLGWIPVIMLILTIQWVTGRGIPQEGQAPDLHGIMIDGQPYPGLSRLPKPALIYFWASWCGICRMMQTTLVDIAGDVPVITVAFQSGDRATVSGYMSKNGFEVPTIVDEEGALGQAYGIRGVPALFVLDRAGNIRYTSIGYTTSVGIRLRLWLARQ